jgi:DHA1 family multidrug resistance protein-like MFS transporter
MWGFGPAEVGMAFMVCGLIMAAGQTGAVTLLSRWLGEVPQVAAGFALMGTSLGVLLTVGSGAGVVATVAGLALGMALIAPNLTALVSQHRESDAGTALGAQNAANSLGQLGGTLGGAVLFGWNMGAPFSLAGGLLVAVGAGLAWRMLGTSRRRTA